MKKQLININPVKEQVKQKLIEKYNSTTYMNTDVIDVRVDIKEVLEAYIEHQHLAEPEIYITTEAYCKMRMLVNKYDTEVGWYGTVTKVPGLPATYVIEDIIVYPQRVTGATVEQDEDRMFEFEMSLTTEQVNMKRFHGHSHVNMGITPSSTDENFYQDILTQVTDFFIITITNKRNEYTVRFYDIEHNILYSDIPIQVMSNAGTPLLDWFDNQSDKIKKPEPIKPTYEYKERPLTGYSGGKSPYADYDDDEDWYRSFGLTPTKSKRGRPKKGR